MRMIYFSAVCSQEQVLVHCYYQWSYLWMVELFALVLEKIVLDGHKQDVDDDDDDFYDADAYDIVHYY